MDSIRISPIQAELTYDIRQRAMWPNESLDFIKLEHDSIGQHWGLFCKDELVSVVSTFDNTSNNTCQFRKFATLPHLQGQGYGSRLLQFIIQKKTPQYQLWCNARKDKIIFYKRFGLFSTEKTFSKKGIQYLIMKTKTN